MERVGVGAGRGREIGDRPRAVGEPPCDVELSDERERARDEPAAQRVPEGGLGRAVGHARAARTAAAASSASSSVSVRQSSRSLPSRTTPTSGGSPLRSGSASESASGAGEARQLRKGQRAAADPANGLLDLAAGRRREPFGPRAHGRCVLAEHAQDRDPLGRLEVEEQRPLERRERELVDPQRALERVAAQPLDELRVAEDDPGLRPAEELVAREADEVGPGRERLPRSRLFLT